MTARTALALLLPLLTAPLAPADDWPQWMGPKRDNVWRESGILDKFPAGGPKRLWSAPVAGGYAGPAVAGGRVFATDYVTAADVKVDNFGRKEFSGTERVFALDAASGKELWKHEYPVKYGISYPAGPRCTPTVHDGKVYFLGAEGDLLCCDAAKGDILWKKNLKSEYKTKSALWGYAAHPLIVGQKLVTLAGGEGSHVVALDKDTGKEIWRSQTQPEQGYSPPLLTDAGGVRQLIVPGPSAVRGLDPDTGKQLWTTPYTADNGSIIMTPIQAGEFLFVGGWNNKNLLLKLASDKPAVEEVWKNKKGFGLSPVNVQPFLDGKLLYGVDQDGVLYAVELPSGERVWESTAPIVEDKKFGSGTAFLVKHEPTGRFVLFNELGELVLCHLTRKGYAEIDRAKLLDPTNNAFGRKVVWCAPAFADKKVYVRNDKELICVDLAK